MMRAMQSMSHCQSLLKFRSFGSLAISKVPDDMLPHLLDRLKDKPQATFNTMANTVQIVKMKLAQAEFYVDEWPQFTSIAGRIVSPTLCDIVLCTSCKPRALELLRQSSILTYKGSHKEGGLIFAEVEASLAEYLVEHLTSNDGKPLLKSMYFAKQLQFPKEKAMLFSNSKPLPLPEGYSIGILKPKDGRYVHHCWNKTLKDHTRDEQQFEHMISTLPTSAVFHKDDPEFPVGWILTHTFGHSGHAFIEKSHRDKKIIPVLGMDHFTKLLQAGIIPEFATEVDRVFATAMRLGFVHTGNIHRLYVDKVSSCLDTANNCMERMQL